MRPGQRGRALCRQHAAIESISGADVVEKRSNLVVLLRKLCDEVNRWGEKLVYQGTKDDSLPPKVLKALDEYLAESNSRLLAIYPLLDERDGSEKKKPARSMLVMECFEAPTEPEQLLARSEVVARHAAPALYNAVEHKRIPMRFVWMPLAKVQEGLGGKTKAIMALVAVALTMLISVLVLVPYPLKMEASGKLLPTIRRVIYSPVMGKLIDFSIVPGESVAENQTLAEMHDLDLQSRMDKLKAEISAADKEIPSLENRERSAPPDERLKVASELAKKRAEKDAKQSELKDLIKRTAADAQRSGTFSLKAPLFTPEQVRMIGLGAQARPGGTGRSGPSSTATSARNGAAGRPSRPTL